MSTLKVNAIRQTGASSDAVTLASDGTCIVKATNNLSNRNMLANGSMAISQRGASFADVTSAHTLDRWKFRNSSGTPAFTITQSTESPDGFGNSLKVDCTTVDSSPAAGSYSRLEQKLEGRDLQALAKGTSSAKASVLSFYVKTNKTGVYTVFLYDNDNSRMWSGSYTVNNSNWNRYTLAIPADTTGAYGNDNNSSLELFWGLSIGSDRSSGTLASSWASYTTANEHAGQVNFADSTSNDWYITGVQYEIDSTGSGVATDFEHRSYGDELVRCQRYYHNYKGDNGDSIGVPGCAWGSTSVTFFVQHPVTMRANPSIEGSGNCRFQSQNDTAAFAISGFSITGAPTDFKTLVFNASTSSATASAGGSLQMQSDDAILGFNAEI